MADGPVGLRAVITEGLFVMAMLLVLVASYALKGIVPMESGYSGLFYLFG